MWARYRRWKSWIFTVLIVAAALLMRGEPDASPGWKAGILLVGTVGGAYVGEEALRMARKRGRPCGRCARKIQPKAFTLRIRCLHCGHSE
jgi:hypothetical protein